MGVRCGGSGFPGVGCGGPEGVAPWLAREPPKGNGLGLFYFHIYVFSIPCNNIEYCMKYYDRLPGLLGTYSNA